MDGTASGWARLYVLSLVPVRELSVDLMGDGQPAVTVIRGEDLRDVAGLWFSPTQRGTFSVSVGAVDACGQRDQTGVRRDVVVR